MAQPKKPVIVKLRAGKFRDVKVHRGGARGAGWVVTGQRARPRPRKR
jgi:hypothetical protein